MKAIAKLPRLNTPMARAFLDHNDQKRQKQRRLDAQAEPFAAAPPEQAG